MTALSTHLRTAADNAHDGKIPSATLSFINQVAAAEREMARDAGAIETARQTLVAAYVEFSDAYGRFSAFENVSRRHPSDALLGEEVARSRADLLASLDWLADCRLKLSTSIRQAQQDAVQASSGAAGRAA